MRIIAAKSACWPARWATLCLRKRCSACGSGAPEEKCRRPRLHRDFMRKAMLFYNPLSGHSIKRLLADVQSALFILRNAGIEISAAPTRAASDATEQTKQAIAEGCDTIFVCGGDGTVHDVLQGIVGTKAAL